MDATITSERRRSWTMPTVYTILFAIIALIAALTWIMPAGKYDYKTADSGEIIAAADVGNYDGGERLLPIPGSYTQLESNPQGVVDVLMAPIKGFYKAADVALFVLIIGGFLSVTIKTGAMDAGVGAVINRFKGREQWLIPILMALFALGGSSYGMAEETVAFWALLLPVMAAAGYDRMVTAGIILLGSGVGVLASTVNPFATGIASRFADLPIGDGIGLRMVIFVVLLALASFYVMRYAAKIKADSSKSILADQEYDDNFSREIEVVELTTRRKLTLLVFLATFAIMVYGVMPLEDIGVTAVPTLWWWFDELSTLFLTASILIALINWQPEHEFVSTFLEGARDLIGVALVVAVARGIYVVMGDGLIVDTVLNWTEGLVTGLSSGAFIVVSYVSHLVLAFLIPSTSGLATVSMPLMGPLADFANVSRELVVTAYQSATGWINMISPTSGHLIAGLALARIPYDRYLKWVAPFMGMTFLITIVILFIAA